MNDRDMPQITHFQLVADARTRTCCTISPSMSLQPRNGVEDAQVLGGGASVTIRRLRTTTGSRRCDLLTREMLSAKARE